MVPKLLENKPKQKYVVEATNFIVNSNFDEDESDDSLLVSLKMNKPKKTKTKSLR